MDTPFVSSRRTSSCQTNAVASTWSALRRSVPTARPKYPASARRPQRGRSGRRRLAISRVQTTSSGNDAGGQRAKERLLESSEMDDRRRGLLRETGGLIGQLAPGMASVDSGPHHVLGDAGDPRHGWRNLLAIGKRDQTRVGVRDCVADSGPADFKEMPARRRGRGLAVDDQHLELRERLGTIDLHNCLDRTLYVRSATARHRNTFVLCSPASLREHADRHRTLAGLPFAGMEAVIQLDVRLLASFASIVYTPVRLRTPEKRSLCESV